MFHGYQELTIKLCKSFEDDTGEINPTMLEPSSRERGVTGGQKG